MSDLSLSNRRVRVSVSGFTLFTASGMEREHIGFVPTGSQRKTGWTYSRWNSMNSALREIDLDALVGRMGGLEHVKVLWCRFSGDISFPDPESHTDVNRKFFRRVTNAGGHYIFVTEFADHRIVRDGKSTLEIVPHIHALILKKKSDRWTGEDLIRWYTDSVKAVNVAKGLIATDAAVSAKPEGQKVITEDYDLLRIAAHLEYMAKKKTKLKYLRRDSNTTFGERYDLPLKPSNWNYVPKSLWSMSDSIRKCSDKNVDEYALSDAHHERMVYATEFLGKVVANKTGMANTTDYLLKGRSLIFPSRKFAMDLLFATNPEDPSMSWSDFLIKYKILSAKDAKDQILVSIDGEVLDTMPIEQEEDTEVAAPTAEREEDADFGEEWIYEDYGEDPLNEEDWWRTAMRGLDQNLPCSYSPSISDTNSDSSGRTGATLMDLIGLDASDSWMSGSDIVVDNRIFLS